MNKIWHWRRGVCLMALAFVLSGCGGDEGPERREVASAPSVIAPV